MERGLSGSGPVGFGARLYAKWVPESVTDLRINSVGRRRNRSDWVIRAGAAITILGIIFSLIALLPLVSTIELPSTWWFLSMVTGIGLATILVGLTMSARSRRHRRSRSR